MKTIVVYYSLDGNCDFIAQNIKQRLNCDLLRLNTKKRLKSAGILKFFWAGKQVVTGEKPELETYTFDASAYDLIIFGTPVWAWHYAPALRTFFENNKFSGRKIALFCCHGGQPGTTLKKLRLNLEGNQIIGEIDFQEPLKTGREAAQKKLNEWLARIIK